jgi:hypothetical protein
MLFLGEGSVRGSSLYGHYKGKVLDSIIIDTGYFFQE